MARQFFAPLLIYMLAAISMMAQEQDSTWDDLGLDPDGFKFDEDIFGHVSTGWFPQPYHAYTISLMGKLFYADVHDRAEGIRPRAFRTTTEPFSWHNPFDSDEREILQPNSDEEAEDSYPVTNYDEYLLSFLYTPPLPALLRADAGLQITEGMLYSNDTSRSYLTLGGASQPFREVSVAHLKQYAIMGSAGVSIPFYGGFISNESTTFASYYYIYGGYSFAYTVSSKGMQYTQIANAKDAIRYGNGTDTVMLVNRTTFEGLNRVRTAIELAIGWNVASDFGAIGMEAFISLPQSSVLKDVDWKQYFAGFRLSLGWHEVIGKERLELPRF